MKKKDNIFLPYEKLVRKKRKAWIEKEEHHEGQRRPSLKNLERSLNYVKWRHDNKVTLEEYEKLYEMREKGRDDEEEDLLYHVQLIELLTKCCVGFNHVPEMIAQALVPLSDCFAIFKDPDADPFVKAAYTRFINEAWLYTERLINLHLDPNMWSLIELFIREFTAYNMAYRSKLKVVGDPFLDDYIFDGALILVKQFYHFIGEHIQDIRKLEIEFASWSKISLDMYTILVEMMETFQEEDRKLKSIAEAFNQVFECKLELPPPSDKIQKLLAQSKEKLGTLTSATIKKLQTKLVEEQRLFECLREYNDELAHITADDDHSSALGLLIKKQVPLKQLEFQHLLQLYTRHLLKEVEQSTEEQEQKTKKKKNSGIKYTQKLIAQLRTPKHIDHKFERLRLDILDLLIAMMDIEDDGTKETREKREKIQDIIGSIRVYKEKGIKTSGSTLLMEAIDLLESKDVKLLSKVLKLCCALFAGGNHHQQVRIFFFFLLILI